jgi:glucose/arabinose dehydrogenase/cytochrome c2
VNKKLILMILTSVVLSQSAIAADANAGKTFFSQQCGLCHTAEPNDNGGAQGPSLQGIFDRAAASGTFSYSQALSSANLTWDADTLDSFLANPTTTVPGSSMVVPVLNGTDRENVIAYFEALGNGSFEDPNSAGFTGYGGSREPVSTTRIENADWMLDAPGRVHRIDVSNLPEPYATEAVSNQPQVVDKPEGAELQVPAGFDVEVFTSELQAPRSIVAAPNGDIFVVETLAGRVKVMSPNADSSAPRQIEVFAQGLLQPLGIAFYPAGDQPEWVYVAETNRVVRYPYQVGDTVANGVPEVVVAELSPVGGGHYTRDLAFSQDGRRMFVSIGSQSNIADDMPTKSASEIQAWEAERGLGAAWGQEENRASVMVFDVGSDRPGRLFATGIRNCVGLTVQPETDDVWCSTNERDMIGDDLVPDYSTRVVDGGFYGWPWYYMGNYEDPRLAGIRPDLAGKAIVPDVPYTAHSAAVDLEFYTASTGSSAFPAEYVGDGFAVLHGSWNRADRTGHKVVRVPIENGVPTGEYIDFMVGFITPVGGTWGRPVAIGQMQDGSMLVSDDGSNLVYRISYSD